MRERRCESKGAQMWLEISVVALPNYFVREKCSENSYDELTAYMSEMF